MKKRVLLFLLILLTLIYQLYNVYSQGSVGIRLRIVEFDSDNDGTPDSTDTDDDNDGILDTSDTLTGNSSSVQSSTVTVNVTVGGSVNLTQSFSGIWEIIFKDSNITLINFSYNLSERTLNLANITIERQNINNRGSILVRGIILTTGQTKTLYVDNRSAINTLCIKEAHIDKITDISSDCLGSNETLITCPSNGTYNCTLVEGSTRFKVDGLNFTGIQQKQDDKGPKIDLTQPKGKSGRTNGNVTFVYKVRDASSVANCSLIINDRVNTTNTSITKDTEINFTLNNIPRGLYNWSINCTDNLSNIDSSDIRKFSVILFEKFNGSTTNISDIDVENITNFIIEVTTSGKINFSENVDIDEGFDLDEDINISFNRIELNSTALSALNKSATLTITGLTFSNPRILRDGAVCPSSICTKVSYSGGALIFNVTQFTAYSSEETPAESAPSSGGGGGGAGGGGGGGGGGGPSLIPIKIDFSVDKTILKVTLKQGQSKEEALSIKNIGTTIFDVKTYLKDIEKFKIAPEVSEITTILNPNEEKSIKLIFKALENEKPDIYTGKILFKGPSIEKEVNVLIEVDSAEPLFDVDIEVLPNSKKIFPGEELLLDVNLFNVRGFGRVDVIVDYSIKEFNGNIVVVEHETLAVETQAKFTRSLLVPSDLRPGTYVALVRVTYGDSVGVSSDVFEVNARSIKLYPIQIKDYRIILFLAAALVIAIVVVFSAYRFGYLRKKIPKGKEEEIKQLREDERVEKLKKELTALESAYKSGFISQESYQKGKKRIEDKLNSLK